MELYGYAIFMWDQIKQIRDNGAALQIKIKVKTRIAQNNTTRIGDKDNLFILCNYFSEIHP